ncbi:MAG: hypothetical protein IT559_08425 [Alphaproteobacteria bacterium]|nr:hypothetical protein [Alphaproteobacteria bacterium]
MLNTQDPDIQGYANCLNTAPTVSGVVLEASSSPENTAGNFNRDQYIMPDASENKVTLTPQPLGMTMG